MHAYAANARSQKAIYLTLAVAAVLAGWGLHRSLTYLSLSPPWWLDTPSVLGFFGLFWKWFDHQLWRVGFLHKWGVIDIPDLRGGWSAQIASSYEAESASVTGEATIEQTWSRISIVIRWPNSQSRSVSAALQAGAGLRQELVYTYVNEPGANAVPTMEMHRGTTWLQVDPGRETLEGHYYSGRGRQQFGDMVLTKGQAA